jgi:hypothetical protein
MTPAEGIDKLGFRRWYERQLIEGHVYFITCFLSLITIAACMELIDWKAPAAQVAFMLSIIVAGGVLCIVSLRRYNFLLLRAECFGSQSSCTHCSTYGVLKVLRAGTGEERTRGLVRRADNPWICVRCKKCGHEWRMHNT